MRLGEFLGKHIDAGAEKARRAAPHVRRGVHAVARGVGPSVGHALLRAFDETQQTPPGQGRTFRQSALHHFGRHLEERLDLAVDAMLQPTTRRG